MLAYGIQGKRIGVISSIANNPNNDPEINAKFAQAIADLEAGGNGDPLFLSTKTFNVQAQSCSRCLHGRQT